MMNSYGLRASIALFISIIFAGTVPVFAQESLSVTIIPPLFQLTVSPGESWTSSIKVVNNNSYAVTYAPQVVDFEAKGEAGQGTFVPLIESFANEPVRTDSLGAWIELSKEPITIESGESAQIEFTVRVPINADPGGHYAAIMVGPYMGIDNEPGSHMKVSSFVTSLLFVRINGEVIESGRIREFTTDKTLYQKPEANFALRFENTGNTHLRPQGSITLYNMWGKERGQVLINEKSNFGNVLPRSIRRFQFAWTGENSAFDIGRYSAVVTLTYGDDGKQNTSAKTYFWVIPIVPAAITLGSIVAVILLMTWFIRRYIRRALSLERVYMGLIEHPDVPDRRTVSETPAVSTFQALVQPLREGVVDLRAVSSAQKPEMRLETPQYAEALTPGGFLMKYRLFFAFVLLVAIAIAGIWLYFAKALVPNRSFEIKEIPQATEPVEAAR
ncbi:MAG: hypothetical protein KBD06_02450 [Candidatus Pacebacteria bacterium]|nr:hypothetical protein [Candidatus Paceibacterota bacterium]